MNNDNKNKGGMIVLLIFLLICSGLGIAAFTMSLKDCSKDGFAEDDEFEGSRKSTPFAAQIARTRNGRDADGANRLGYVEADLTDEDDEI